jgi:hypothetical protein
MIYRFEVTLNKESSMGLFQAPFNSVLLNEDELTLYYELIQKLRCPEIAGKPSFYFTRRGYMLFYPLVEILLKAIPKSFEPELHTIQFARATKATKGRVVYRDRNQIAVSIPDKLRSPESKLDYKYWREVMQCRMEEQYEVTRLTHVLKGFLYDHNLYEKKINRGGEDTPLSFWDSKRPYGVKNIGKSIAFNLGWDQRRKLDREEMPKWVYQEADRLHQLVKKELEYEEELTSRREEKV